MSQEHLFCAEIYHALYQHIDHSRPIRFCLDGSAAARLHRNALLQDACIPDFCFFFIGGQAEFLAETKIVRKGKVTFYGPGQPLSWHNTGSGRLKPALWLGADDDLQCFWCWEHRDFDCALTPNLGEGLTPQGEKKEMKRDIPTVALTFTSIARLASHAVRYARKHGYYP